MHEILEDDLGYFARTYAITYRKDNQISCIFV